MDESMSKKQQDFYTVRGYSLLKQEEKQLTPSMEDYLEMSYRLTLEKGYARIGDLAEALHVQPPSASKMMQKLTELGYVQYEKYGLIELTSKGNELGRYLLKRHQIVEKLLILIGVTDNLLEQTEKIEHNLSAKTLEKIETLVLFLEDNQDWSALIKSTVK
ncbi:MAG: transcriptional regulator MntR [Peptococcia bacterium]|jgi:DtxR family Mn-dependent transcriptional regulator